MMRQSIKNAILHLKEAIEQSQHSFSLSHKMNQRINLYNKDEIYFLKSGTVTAYTDHHDLLLYSIFAPDIIAIEKTEEINSLHHLRCMTDVELIAIHRDEFRQILDQKQLWPYAFSLLTQYYEVLSIRDGFIFQENTKEIIIKYLKYIWSFEVEHRMNTSIYTYITSRVHISRASIHKTVTSLEQKSLIQLKRGVLIDCHLP